jgi:glycosyltransferase involved in cell wall biosynthesis
VGLGLCEIIVVNNNSTDKTQAVAEAFAAKHPQFRVVVEKKQGLSHARNRGYKEARAEWVAYLDDDAKAFPEYLERLLYVIDHYDFDCFGGIYLPWYKFGKPKWFKDSYGSNERLLDNIGVLEQGYYISGGVSAFKKSVLEYLGGFPTQIGMNSSRIAYGEEVQIQVKMRQKGFKIGFDPGLRIEHVVADYKLSPFWFARSAYANGRDSWCIFCRRKTWLAVFIVANACPCFFLINLFKYTPKLILEDYYIQNWFIDVFRPILGAFGKIFGNVFMK